METFPNKSPKAKTGKRKILLYVFFTLIVVLLFFVVLEFLARTARNAGLVNPERPDDRVAYADNPFIKVTIKGVKYYESSSQWMVKSRFLVKKPRRLYRIFILGESFAMGFPYVAQQAPNDKGGMDSWIRAELEVLGLAKRFEIINAAAGSQNSFSVKNYAKAACDSGADLIIIATGNNEGYSPSELNILLNKLTSYRLLKKAILREPDLFERPTVPPKNESLKIISSAFRKNLEEIILYAKEKKVAVALATLPINLRGVVLVHSSALLSKEYLEGLRLRREGSFQKAIDVFLKSPESGAKYFQIGKCLEGLGRFDDAFKAYMAAVTLDPANRMLPTHNDMIKDMAKEYNLLLIDLESRIKSMAKNGIPGMEQFQDYCHMRWRYYAACADEITSTLRSAGIIPHENVPWNDFDEKLEMLLKQMKTNESYLRMFEHNPPIFFAEEDDYWVHNVQ